MADTGRYRFSQWLRHDWSQAGLIAAVLLLVSPPVGRGAGYSALLIYLWLPAYMVHQYEEHTLGNFLEWIRRVMPRNAAFLTERKVVLINLGIVWFLRTIRLSPCPRRPKWTI